jgi:hypothetical protein
MIVGQERYSIVSPTLFHCKPQHLTIYSSMNIKYVLLHVQALGAHALSAMVLKGVGPCAIEADADAAPRAPSQRDHQPHRHTRRVTRHTPGRLSPAIRPRHGALQPPRAELCAPLQKPDDRR